MLRKMIRHRLMVVAHSQLGTALSSGAADQVAGRDHDSGQEPVDARRQGQRGRQDHEPGHGHTGIAAATSGRDKAGGDEETITVSELVWRSDHSSDRPRSRHEPVRRQVQLIAP